MAEIRFCSSLHCVQNLNSGFLYYKYVLNTLLALAKAHLAVYATKANNIHINLDINKKRGKMKELGIYIHIPFCKQKCYYCDFVSYANKEEKIQEYVKCLQKEIEIESAKYKSEEYEINTIYIGGGTPSFIDASYIANIINTIKQNYKLNKNSEITIEINPGTISKEKIEKYREVGINRISIGLQTTKDNLLRKIGRIHTYEEFLSCYKLVQKEGFNNINVDLMLGLPNQTLEDLKESLKEIISLQPNHISLYSLILEENTKLEKMVSKKELDLPSEDIERKMYWETKKILEQNGYIHYEISNFSKAGYESKHNLNCWSQKEYLGFGIAAHSYKNNKRYCNTNNIDEYIKNIQNENIENNRTICEIQNKTEEQKEYMLLGLRKIEGINIQEFKNKFIDNPIYIFHKELEKLVKEKLIQIDLNQIKLTSKGLDFANLVWKEFI